jgi:hypothetical protein
MAEANALAYYDTTSIIGRKKVLQYRPLVKMVVEIKY